MKNFGTVLLTTLALPLALLGTACSPSEVSQNAADKDNGIRLGNTAEADHFISKSTVAVIGGNMEMVCSGTLIADNLVLTAAHCISDKVQMYVVFSNNAADKKMYRRADGIVVHPNYVEEIGDARGIVYNRGDIAVIHYEGTTPGQYVPAQILGDYSVLERDEYGYVAGYGIADDFPALQGHRDLPSNLIGSGTGLLRYAKIMIDDPDFSETEISFDQKWGKGACQGDSGGPAYVVVKDKPMLLGVASWGEIRAKDSGCLKMVVYTKVLPHLKFINSAAKMLVTKARQSR